MIEPIEIEQFDEPTPQVQGVNARAKPDGAVAPGATDDYTEGFEFSSSWFDAAAGNLYHCIDNTEDAAEWVQLLTPSSDLRFGNLIEVPGESLVGREASGLGAPIGIAVGSGLSLSGGTLSATGGGMTIGDAVSGGGANRVLYEDGSQNLAASANLTYEATNGLSTDKLTVTTAFVLRKNGGESIIEATYGQQLQLNGHSYGVIVRPESGAGSYILENDSGYIKQTFRTSGGTAVGIMGISSSKDLFLQGSAFANIQFIADGRTASPLTRFIRNGTAVPSLSRWEYDVSNYCDIDVSSAGAVTFDAVGASAGFTFKDRLIMDTKAIQPGDLADSAAPTNSIYFSTDAAKLVYKDKSGTVNNLY